FAHHARLAEDAQVLRNRRAADVEMFGELVHAVRAAEQVLEHRATRGIGHRAKRVGRIGNHMVTHYESAPAMESTALIAHDGTALIGASSRGDLEFTRRKPQDSGFAIP